MHNAWGCFFGGGLWFRLVIIEWKFFFYDKYMFCCDKLSQSHRCKVWLIVQSLSLNYCCNYSFDWLVFNWCVSFWLHLSTWHISCSQSISCNLQPENSNKHCSLDRWVCYAKIDQACAIVNLTYGLWNERLADNVGSSSHPPVPVKPGNFFRKVHAAGKVCCQWYGHTATYRFWITENKN